MNRLGIFFFGITILADTILLMGMEKNNIEELSTYATYVPFLSFLLNQPKDINKRQYRYGNTALIEASIHNHSEIVRLLLKNPHLNLNTPNFFGDTALLMACALNHDAIIQILICEPQIAVNNPNFWSFTPLIIASIRGNIPIAKALLSHPEILPNQRTFWGYTALQYAIYYKHTEIVALITAHQNDLLTEEQKMWKAYFKYGDDIQKLINEHDYLPNGDQTQQKISRIILNHLLKRIPPD